MSAPARRTGAAALVWQRYPYFDNDLVRQTLLGTATDLEQEATHSLTPAELQTLSSLLRKVYRRPGA